MGTRGPAPKRAQERTRTNTHNEYGESMAVSKGTATDVEWPEPMESWEPMARDFYLALKKSGMSAYYQQSDVALAMIVANELSLYLKSYEGKRSAMMLASLMSAMGGLGVTEFDRRRMRIELEAEKPVEVPASVTAIAEYKKALGVKK